MQDDGLEQTRRRGRPGLAEDGAETQPVHVRFPPAEYDELYRLAQRSEATIPDLVRLAVRRLMADEKGGALVIR